MSALGYERTIIRYLTNVRFGSYADMGKASKRRLIFVHEINKTP